MAVTMPTRRRILDAGNRALPVISVGVLLFVAISVVVVWRGVDSGNSLTASVAKTNEMNGCRGVYSAKVGLALAQEVRAFGSLAQATASHDDAAEHKSLQQVAAADTDYDTAYGAYLNALNESTHDPTAFLHQCNA